jgi:hypothetical protein
MGKPVNLNRFRKDKARAEKKARADANAAKHGRSKAERELDKAREDKAVRDIESHKLDK